jgi:hypothetical protein
VVPPLPDDPLEALPPVVVPPRPDEPLDEPLDAPPRLEDAEEDFGAVPPPEPWLEDPEDEESELAESVPPESSVVLAAAESGTASMRLPTKDGSIRIWVRETRLSRGSFA